MKEQRFDRVVRALGERIDRRNALSGVIGIVAVVAAVVETESADARRKRRRGHVRNDGRAERDRGQPEVRAPRCREEGHPCESNQRCCPELICAPSGPGSANRCTRCPNGSVVYQGTCCTPRACSVERQCGFVDDECGGTVPCGPNGGDCPGGSPCADGQCQSSCEAGQTPCGAGCCRPNVACANPSGAGTCDDNCLTGCWFGELCVEGRDPSLCGGGGQVCKNCAGLVCAPRADVFGSRCVEPVPCGNPAIPSASDDCQLEDFCTVPNKTRACGIALQRTVQKNPSTVICGQQCSPGGTCTCPPLPVPQGNCRCILPPRRKRSV